MLVVHCWYTVVVPLGWYDFLFTFGRGASTQVVVLIDCYTVFASVRYACTKVVVLMDYYIVQYTVVVHCGGTVMSSARKRRRTQNVPVSSSLPQSPQTSTASQIDYVKLASEIIRQQNSTAVSAGCGTPASCTQSGPSTSPSTSTASVSQVAQVAPATAHDGGHSDVQTTSVPNLINRIFSGESPAVQSTPSVPLPFSLADGIPIGATVSQKIKQKIWDDEYLDFHCLLSSYSEDPLSIDISPGIINVKQNSKYRHPLSINQWTTCFLTFMAIYIKKHLVEAPHLLKYALTVRELHQNFGDTAWRSYDEHFRKLRQSHRVPWQRYIHDLVKPSNLYQKGYSPSSIAGHMSAISYVHKLLDIPDPTQSFLIRKLLKGAQNLSKAPDTRMPITKQLLHQILSSLNHTAGTAIERHLLQSLFSLAFHGFFRLGELIPKTAANVDRQQPAHRFFVKCCIKHFPRKYKKLAYFYCFDIDDGNEDIQNRSHTFLRFQNL
ncbi:hypothetical protein KUTeg_002778 [Tegillarca granosa]|uniref:Uncharacterized protein n=1 Tax=Tegillarca granosa TaxID=220873 RepID=A0ABQ9FQV5_TEGGR|nr:hypothetical protein KUTeg_002778 [Tegillarca granosa]